MTTPDWNAAATSGLQTTSRAHALGLAGEREAKLTAALKLFYAQPLRGETPVDMLKHANGMLAKYKGFIKERMGEEIWMEVMKTVAQDVCVVFIYRGWRDSIPKE